MLGFHSTDSNYTLTGRRQLRKLRAIWTPPASLDWRVSGRSEGCCRDGLLHTHFNLDHWKNINKITPDPFRLR